MGKVQNSVILSVIHHRQDLSDPMCNCMFLNSKNTKMSQIEGKTWKAIKLLGMRYSGGSCEHGEESLFPGTLAPSQLGYMFLTTYSAPRQ
jgi:hypothetical protein